MNHAHRRRLRAWLAKQHAPLTSWQAASHDAYANGVYAESIDLDPVPDLATARAILWAIRDATDFELAANNRFGINATPDSLCAVLATVAANVATTLTGYIYRIQSGPYGRVLDQPLAESSVTYTHRTGKGDDFHTWAVAAFPSHKLIFLDPQAMWWTPVTILWDNAPTVHRQAHIAWKAHSATTARIQALVSEPAHAAIVSAIERRALELSNRYLPAAPHIGTFSELDPVFPALGTINNPSQ